MSSETIEIFAKRYLGSATSEDYVAWAIACLEQNIDSKNIRILASLHKPLYLSEVEEYFNRSLKDLGWTMPERRECLLQYARLLAQQIVSGDLRPVEGCRAIYGVVVALHCPAELSRWVNLDEGLHPDLISDLHGSDWDDAIRSEAEHLLKETAPLDRR